MWSVWDRPGTHRTNESTDRQAQTDRHNLVLINEAKKREDHSSLPLSLFSFSHFLMPEPTCCTPNTFFQHVQPRYHQTSFPLICATSTRISESRQYDEKLWLCCHCGEAWTRKLYYTHQSHKKNVWRILIPLFRRTERSQRNVHSLMSPCMHAHQSHPLVSLFSLKLKSQARGGLCRTCAIALILECCVC